MNVISMVHTEGDILNQSVQYLLRHDTTTDVNLLVGLEKKSGHHQKVKVTKVIRIHPLISW